MAELLTAAAVAAGVAPVAGALPLMVMTLTEEDVAMEEKGIADKLDVGPGKKVLDVGCGRGRIVHHVASYTGAKVVGLNVDKTQHGLGKEYAVATDMLGNKLAEVTVELFLAEDKVLAMGLTAKK